MQKTSPPTCEINERDKITERDSQSKSFDLNCESSSSPGTTGAAFSSWSRAISHTSNDLQGTFHALTVPQTPSVRQHFRRGRLSKSGAGGRFRSFQDRCLRLQANDELGVRPGQCRYAAGTSFVLTVRCRKASPMVPLNTLTIGAL